MISLTITSCKRPILFYYTISSLVKNCEDLDLISEIVWSDDHTNDDDFEVMLYSIRRIFPNTPLKYQHRKNEEPKGLSYSLNWILENISNQYVLHVEDDWLFIQKGNFIRNSLNILEENNNIKQVLLKERNMFPSFQTSKGVKYTIWEKGIALDGQNVESSGFTLNPSVIDAMFYYKNYGFFSSVNIEGSWNKFYEEGIRTACLSQTCIEHIGLDQSSFNLNNTNR